MIDINVKPKLNTIYLNTINYPLFFKTILVQAFINLIGNL